MPLIQVCVLELLASVVHAAATFASTALANPTSTTSSSSSSASSFASSSSVPHPHRLLLSFAL